MRGEPGITVRGGEFAFAYQHPAWVCEVHEEVGAPMAEHIKTKRDEIGGMLKPRNGGGSQGNGHSFQN